MPPNPIWLTFDDSYQNVYDYAYSIMNSRGLKASIMTVTQYMGQMNSWDLGSEPQHLHITWNMLQQMKNSGFFTDSHTQHHVHFYSLTIPQTQAEVWGSQRDLVSFTGTPGVSFSYPYGQYPDYAKWEVAHSGFKDGVIVVAGKQYTDYADLYESKRIIIYDSDTLSNFITKITAP
jgi:peptidoglycan/xylan/chitin deacetylase (PgdA/CDA1 family)